MTTTRRRRRHNNREMREIKGRNVNEWEENGDGGWKRRGDSREWGGGSRITADQMEEGEVEKPSKTCEKKGTGRKNRG